VFARGFNGLFFLRKENERWKVEGKCEKKDWERKGMAHIFVDPHDPCSINGCLVSFALCLCVCVFEK